MTDNKEQIKELEEVVIRFSGDSGDGMQLTGMLFSDTSALLGNDLATFPDYPAEIRAPQGTVGGVSGFQVHFGHAEVNTPGDYADVLVAMNPAALKANIKWIKRGGTIIIDIDSFTEKNFEKAGCVNDPLDQIGFRDFNIIKAPISTLTRESLKGLNLDTKSILRSKNMFALGMVYWLFHRPLEFHNCSPCPDHPWRMGVYFHPLIHRVRAGRNQIIVAIHFNHTNSASSRW